MYIYIYIYIYEHYKVIPLLRLQSTAGASVLAYYEAGTHNLIQKRGGSSRTLNIQNCVLSRVLFKKKKKERL